MSLEVPSEQGTPTTAEPTKEAATLQNITNGSSDTPHTSATYIPGMDDGLGEIGVEKRNSLGRAAPTSAARGRKPVGLARMSMDQSKRNSVGSDGGRVGVSLTDKPMDD